MDRQDLYAKIGIGLAVFSAVAGALGTYWSYTCRSSGQFCEGSIAAPSEEVTGRHRADLQLQNKPGTERVVRLEARRAGLWPLFDRWDVIARSSNGSDSVVGSVPSSSSTRVVPDASSGSLFFVNDRTNADTASIVGFFLGATVEERIFKFIPSSPDQRIEIRNLSYDKTEDRIEFDVSSNEEMLRLHNGLEWGIGGRDLNKARGATMVLQLNKQKNADKLFSREDEARFKASQEALVKCKSEAEQAARSLGELFPCFFRDFTWMRDYSFDPYAWEIYEWQGKGKGLTRVDSSFCSASGSATRNASGAAVLVTCNDRPGADKSIARAKIDIFKAPHAKEKVIFVKGSCNGIYLWDAELISSKIVLDIETDCERLDFGGLGVDLGAGVAGRRSFEVEIDDRFLPKAFRPRLN